MELQAVLLVDDDRPTNFLHSRLLHKLRCDVHIHEVNTVADALNYLLAKDVYHDRPEEHDPQLILLDLNMPKANGWEFLDDYARHFAADDHIIIVLTTSLNPDDEQAAVESEYVTEFRRKPLTKDAITEILGAYFYSGGELR